MNLFVPSDDSGAALDALPVGIEHSPETVEAIERDGQIRVWWDDTPVDLFFAYAPIHGDAARNRRLVPFEGVRIPVLGPVELAVFKAMFDRTRDWADIEAMIEAGTLDLDAVHAALRTMVPAGDDRYRRLDDAAERVADGSSALD